MQLFIFFIYDIVLSLSCVVVVNPCEEQTDKCAKHATCMFAGISHQYTCSCGQGFIGDGFDPCSGR